MKGTGAKFPVAPVESAPMGSTPRATVSAAAVAFQAESRLAAATDGLTDRRNACLRLVSTATNAMLDLASLLVLDVET